VTDCRALLDNADTLCASLMDGGAFLVTIAPNGQPNPMTIGWGLIGIAVQAPMFSIYVTRGGYTYEYVQEAKSFTVSVPALGELSEELSLCGSRSGRETDKAAEADLTLASARCVPAPVVAGCVLYYECEKLRFSERENGDLVVFGRVAASYAPG